MTFIRLIAGRHSFFCHAKVMVCGAFAAGILLLTFAPGFSADFPFDRELLLDAKPMRPGKRMPVLNVEPNGNARLDLWCKTVTAHVELSDASIKIEPAPLPEALPEMMGNGQCTLERMAADQTLLDELSQATAWQFERDVLVLTGPTPLRFRESTH